MHKKVGIFCRLNAARSPLLEAFLSRHNPGHTFFSGGIFAEEGTGLPGITREFAKSIGLSNLKDSSNHVRNQEKMILEADLLLAADDLTSQMLEETYPKKHFLSIESRAREMGITLVDPVNSVGYEFNYLLGRFLFFGFSAFREHEGEINSFPISALIANQENVNGELSKLLESLSLGDRNPLILDCNFKFATKGAYLGVVPENQRYQAVANSIINLNEDDLREISFISPSHEVISWERFVSSPVWRSWLAAVSRSRPILLLCTPVDIIEGEKHNSFLEAINADHLVYRA
jgi:protein-tyrosine-phosphatase